MIGRGISALKTGISVVFNAMGLMALLAAAWLMPTILELVVRVAAAG